MRRARRKGVVLIVVLWAVVILSVIALNFGFLVKTHLRVASNYANTFLLRNVASAGVEFAIATLRQDKEPVDYLGESWASAEKGFAQVPVGEGAFTLWRSPREGEETEPVGMEDEASKLNLRTATQEMLLRLKGMDQTKVESLLDWQDEDAAARAAGAEEEYYGNLTPPEVCKNAPLDTLAELLLVRGFDPVALYGEDANHNGALDPNENDGDASWPVDNADGVLDSGLLRFVTIYSADKNVSMNDAERVNLNDADENQLRQGVPGLADPEIKAIVAYRNGRKYENLGDLLNVTEAPTTATAPNPQGRAPEGQGRGNADGVGTWFGSGETTPTIPGPFPQQPQAPPRKIFSPERVKQIIDYCAITSDKTTAGRVNVNTAPREVLATLPGMTDEVAQAVVAQRARRPFSSIAELLDVPGVSQDAFIQVSNLVTVRSYQFRVRSEAQLQGLEARRTVEAVVDRSGEKVKFLYWNEE